jgi:3-methyladenine DNA glycosylase AlkD
MNSLIDSLRNELLKTADEKILDSQKRFFREEVKLYGLKSTAVEKIGKAYYEKTRNASKDEIFSLCELLFRSGYLEESFIACGWSYNVRKLYEKEDIAVFSKWIDNYVSNWATCDTLCNHTVGTFIEMYPEYIAVLKEWAFSKNLWKRRASAVTLIVPAKKGLFFGDVLEIADLLLKDKEDMVQKGYGWMLKVAANNHEKEVFNYVMRNKAVMPRTALRYAIEKMPAELKAEAMKKADQNAGL